MDDDVNETDYEKKLTENRYEITRYICPEDFFDYLLSNHVLTENDKDVISNPYVNDTRRKQAGKLLDVVATKGPNGYKFFMHVLEWEYPHVFEKMTGKQAESSPDTEIYRAEMRVKSKRLKLINELPQLVKAIQHQFKQNTNLNGQLEELKHILELSKKENQDLEKENESLQRDLRKIQHDKEGLEKDLKTCQIEKDDLKSNVTKTLLKSLEYIDQRDHYRDKWQSVQVEKGDCERKISEMKEIITHLENKECSGNNTAGGSSLVEEAEKEIEAELQKSQKYSRREIKLVCDKHCDEIEKVLDDLKRKQDKFKRYIWNSLETLQESSESDPCSVGDEEINTEDDIPVPYKALIPSPVGRLPKMYTEKALILLRPPIVNKMVELKGGNYTGIYISKVYKSSGITGLDEGDQIVSLTYKGASEKPENISLSGITLEEAIQHLNSNANRIELEIRRCPQEYYLACTWIDKHGGQSGDYFFVKYTSSTSLASKSGEINLRKGDILVVTNSYHDATYWYATKLRKDTGYETGMPGRIANRTDQKCDKPFQRVLPMKAYHKLPVLLIGPDVLVDAVIEVVTKDSKLFKYHGGDLCSEIDHQQLCGKTHYLGKVKLEKVNRYYPRSIVILVQCTSAESGDGSRNLFGVSFDMKTEDVTQCTKVQERLNLIGASYELLQIPHVSIQNSSDLVATFEKLVAKSQDRILWLSAQEMDATIAEQFTSLLGKRTGLCHSHTSQYVDEHL